MFLILDHSSSCSQGVVQLLFHPTPQLLVDNDKLNSQGEKDINVDAERQKLEVGKRRSVNI